MASRSGNIGSGRNPRQLNINELFRHPPVANINRSPPLSPHSLSPSLSVGSPPPISDNRNNQPRSSRSNSETSLNPTEGEDQSQPNGPDLHQARRYKRAFKAVWKTGRPWLMHLRPPGGPELGLMKCKACIYGHARSIWATVGCRSMQYSSVKDHERSQEHKLFMPGWEAKERGHRDAPMARHVENMINREQARIITCMKILYFTIQKDRSILSYEDTCLLLRELHAPDMPVNDDYGAYTSVYAALEFLWSISEHLKDKFLAQIHECPSFSLMIDESTDRTLEQHLIIYVCYITGNGSGVPVTQFVELSSVASGTGESIYATVNEVLNKLHLDKTRLVAVATDGASAMIGSRIGLTTRLRNDQPSLVNVHCIAHR